MWTLSMVLIPFLWVSAYSLQNETKLVLDNFFEMNNQSGYNYGENQTFSVHYRNKIFGQTDRFEQQNYGENNTFDIIDLGDILYVNKSTENTHGENNTFDIIDLGDILYVNKSTENTHGENNTFDIIDLGDILYANKPTESTHDENNTFDIIDLGNILYANKPTEGTHDENNTFDIIDLGDILYANKPTENNHGQNTFNILVDSVIKIIQEDANATMPAPDFHKKIKAKIGLVLVRVDLHATNGYIADIRTAQRKGDCTLEKNGDTTKMKLIVGLGHLLVHYEYKIVFLSTLEFTGIFEIKIKNNCADFQLNLKKNDDVCSVDLDHFVLSQFSDIEVKLCDTKPFSWITNVVATKLVNYNRETIKKLVENQVALMAPEMLEKFKGIICNLPQ